MLIELVPCHVVKHIASNEKLYLWEKKCIHLLACDDGEKNKPHRTSLLQPSVERVQCNLQWLSSWFTVSSHFFKWRTVNSNTTGVINGVGTANPSGASVSTSGFQWRSCCSVFSCLCRTVNSNTTGVISGIGTANPSGAPEFPSVF
jgi:phage tail protein X